MSNYLKQHQYHHHHQSMKMMNKIKVKVGSSSCDEHDHDHHQLLEDYSACGGVGVGGGNNSNNNNNNNVFSWPPRSYTCSFCKREFRSAQALGGHMNVHRRDRARLRHSSPPPPTPSPTLTSRLDSSKYSLIPNLNLDPNPNNNNFMMMMMNPSFSSDQSSPPTSATTFISSLVPGHLNYFSTSSSATANHVPTQVMIPTLTTTTSKNKDVLNNYKLGNSMKHYEENGDGDDYDDDHEMEEAEEEEESNIIGMKKAEIIRLELEIGLLGEAKEDLDLELRLGYTTTTTTT